MSSLMIILLILILITISPCRNEGKSVGTEKNENFVLKNNRKFKLANYSLNYEKNDNFSIAKGQKLRHDLENLMSRMVTKIIQRRRWKKIDKFQSQKKMKNFKTRKNTNFPSEFSIKNQIDDRQDGIREAISRDLIDVSKSFERLLRGTGSWRIRKVRGKVKIKSSNRNEVLGNSRMRRASEEDRWIKKDFEDEGTSMKMHALIVRDEDIPPCCSPAKEVTNQRYFMCSGAVLTLKHAITTASCMHFADIFEHNIEADLAILVGATETRAYVIKINRYDMHPDYNYDVEAKDHATNNLAIIYLQCSLVAQDTIVPSLPKGINDDVAHLCCREGCDVITIVQGPDNRHTARMLKARHLPAPRHDYDFPTYRQSNNLVQQFPNSINKQIVPNETLIPPRRIRSALRLAAAPIFFGKQPRATSIREPISDATNHRKRKNTKKLEASTSQGRVAKKNKPSNLDDLANGRKFKSQIPILRALEEEGVDVEEQLAAVDWEKIEEEMSRKYSKENRETMEAFAKKVTDETIRRLETVLGDDETETVGSGKPLSPKGGKGSGGEIFAKLMENDKKNKTIESFVKVFTKVVTSLVPPNTGSAIGVSSDISVEETDLDDPPSIYEVCPPLGAPIIVDGMLVGLLAYTCDDVQSWVEWKYANVARNMNWIRKKISAPYEPLGKCSSGEKWSRSLTEAPIVKSQRSENRNEMFHDGKVEWREIGNAWRYDSRRNFDDVEVPMTETSRGTSLEDSWLARNSQPSPVDRRSSNERILANSRDRSKSSFVRHVPVYNVNTCYVKEDGSIDCRTSTEFDVR